MTRSHSRRVRTATVLAALLAFVPIACSRDSAPATAARAEGRSVAAAVAVAGWGAAG